MASYRLDPVAFREELLNAEWMVALMRERAQRGLEYVQATAPRDTGEYADSASVESHKHGGVHGDRAEAILSSADPDALPKEFGHTTKGGTHVDGAFTYTRAMDAMRE